MDHRVGWGIECANNRSTNRDKRDEMGKRRGYLSSWDSLSWVMVRPSSTLESIVVFFSPRLVADWWPNSFLGICHSSINVKGESMGVPSVMKSESTIEYCLTSNVSADVGFDCRLWIKLIKTKLCIFKGLSTYNVCQFQEFSNTPSNIYTVWPQAIQLAYLPIWGCMKA